MPDSHPNEVWKEIPNTNGRYKVSSHGRVWQDITRIRNRSITRHPEIMHQFRNRKGYPCVNVTYISGQVTHAVHALVAAAFIGPCPEGLQCNHKDGDKTNNHASNLEYVTLIDNIRHAEANGLRGIKAHRLTDNQVKDIFSLWQMGLTQRQIAANFGVSQRTVWEVLHRLSYRDVVLHQYPPQSPQPS